MSRNIFPPGTVILPASSGSKTANDLKLEDLHPDIEPNAVDSLSLSSKSPRESKGNFGWNEGEEASTSGVGQHRGITFDTTEERKHGTDPYRSEGGASQNNGNTNTDRSTSIDVSDDDEALDFGDNQSDTVGDDRSSLLKTEENLNLLLDAASMGNVQQSRRAKKKRKKQSADAARQKSAKNWKNHMANLKEEIGRLRDEVNNQDMWGQAMDARGKQQREAEAAAAAASSLYGTKKRIDSRGETISEVPNSGKVKEVMKPFTGLGQQKSKCLYCCG